MTQQQPPGWYPDGQGNNRYWDGTQWTAHTQQSDIPQAMPVAAPLELAPEEQRGQAALAHGLGALGFVVPVFGWVAPLIIYLVAKPDQPFVKDQASESLNFQLTLVIAYVVSGIAVFFCVGLFMLIAVWVLNLALPLVGMTRANRGEWYRYPLTIRMVPKA